MPGTSGTGHLVFMRLGNLMAVSFDATTATIIGKEFGLIENVMQAAASGGDALNTGAGHTHFGFRDTRVHDR